MMSAGRYNALLLAGVLTLGVSDPAVADDTTDLYFQQVIERYYESPTTARVFAMAGTMSLLSADSSSVAGNPAGLGWMQGGEVSGTYSYNEISGDEFPTRESVSQDGHIGMGLLALPLGPTIDALPRFGNVGFGWNRYETDWKDDTFDTHSERQQIHAAYAKAINERVSLGYSLTWTEDKFQAREIFNYPMHDGFKHTAGVQWKATDNIMLGNSLFIGHGKHHALFGPGIKGDSDTFQVGTDIGAGFRFGPTLLAVSVDYRYLDTDGDVESSIPANVVGGDEEGHVFNARIGLEQQLGDIFAARIGYRFAGLAEYEYDRPELEDLEGDAYYHALSLGAGLNFRLNNHYFRAVRLDYGVEYRAAGNDDWQHVVTASIPFNLCRP